MASFVLRREVLAHREGARINYREHGGSYCASIPVLHCGLRQRRVPGIPGEFCPIRAVGCARSSLSSGCCPVKSQSKVEKDNLASGGSPSSLLGLRPYQYFVLGNNLEGPVPGELTQALVSASAHCVFICPMNRTLRRVGDRRSREASATYRRCPIGHRCCMICGGRRLPVSHSNHIVDFLEVPCCVSRTTIQIGDILHKKRTLVAAR